MSAGAPPRIHLEHALAAGDVFDLPPAQARHVQVLRLQPGAALTLFNGTGGEWRAEVLQMGRASVGVRVDAHIAVERELAREVTLAIGMPANERMDALVEKAAELGAAAIQPLLCERSVLRLAGERAARRLAHWRGIAIAASEQSGRTRPPRIDDVRTLSCWLDGLAPAAARTRHVVLSPTAATAWDAAAAGPTGSALIVLSGPEGGLTATEESAARRAGFAALSLGPRILRADTAPLALLAWCALEPAPTRGD
jgi:16S rRNA (uracil1498-N3)-methyltransferase